MCELKRILRGWLIPFLKDMVAALMQYWFFITLTLIFGSVVDAGSFYVTADLPRVAQIKSQIEKSFVLDRSKTDWEWMILIQDAIFQADRYESDLTSAQVAELSKKIVQTAKCYSIDPSMFAALIWKESNFNASAVSFRGAVGLTQMTQSGIKEVLERVSLYSPRKLKFLSSLLKKCNPAVARRIPRVISADTVAAAKNQTWTFQEQSLVYGALLLKLNLASVKEPSLKKSYFRAFERYNGDSKVKQRFAADVLSLREKLIEPKFQKSAARF